MNNLIFFKFFDNYLNFSVLNPQSFCGKCSIFLSISKDSFFLAVDSSLIWQLYKKSIVKILIVENKTKNETLSLN